MTTTLDATVRRFNFQSDIYRGAYRLVDEVEPGVYDAEHLAPEPELLERMLDDAIAEEAAGHYGVFGSDKLAGVQAEWDARVARAGTTFRVRLVGRAGWDAAF